MRVEISGLKMRNDEDKGEIGREASISVQVWRAADEQKTLLDMCVV